MPRKRSGGRAMLILGGVRSGKSRYALELAARSKRVAFIATAEARDQEMSARIAHHRAERPRAWHTIEAPIDLPGALDSCNGKFDAVIVDCLTLWASNLMEHEGRDIARLVPHMVALTETLETAETDVILVSNEVGSGIVPDNELGRMYRDLLGGLNQRVAAIADEVVLLVAGCPLIVKRKSSASSAKAHRTKRKVARQQRRRVTASRDVREER